MTSIAEKPKSSPKSVKRPSSASASTGGGPASVASSSSAARLTHQSSTGSLLGNMRSSRDRDIMNFVPPAAECSYAACFCEENVWKLCDHVRSTAKEELAKSFVIFVSNKKQVNDNIDFPYNFPKVISDIGTEKSFYTLDLSKSESVIIFSCNLLLYFNSWHY